MSEKLKADLRAVDELCCRLGEAFHEDPEETYVERYLYTLSVAVWHIIEWIERREK